jgi:hypothetical protein
VVDDRRKVDNVKRVVERKVVAEKRHSTTER